LQKKIMNTLPISAPTALSDSANEGEPGFVPQAPIERPVRRQRFSPKSSVPVWLRIHAKESPVRNDQSAVHGLKLSSVHELGMLFMSILGEIFLTDKDSETYYRLTGAQKKIILFLALKGPQRMGEVADLISSSMPAASAVIDRLESMNLVNRRRDTEDRRVVMVELTDAGRAVYLEMNRVREERLNRLFDSMPDSNRIEFAASLERALELALRAAKSAAAEAEGAKTP
jgi:DNA-binding MarR family transcriptional regulator